MFDYQIHKSSLNNLPPLVDASKIGSSRLGGSCKSVGGGSVVVELAKAADAEAELGAELEVVVEDADNDEVLERRPVALKVELNDWN